MSSLSQKSCKACRMGDTPFSALQIDQYMKLLDPSWQVIDQHHLEKTYKFKNFKEALDFVNQIGSTAEKEGHHPDISLSWGKVGVVLFTHKIKGLSESDFIMAAKIDQLL